MFDPTQAVRAHIRAMPPYEPILPVDVLSAELGLPPERLVKLDANENPYGPLPEVSQALAALPYTHIYPDPQSRALRAALAGAYDLPIEVLLAGAGADELIDLLMDALIDEGDAILNCPPTFGMYSFDGDAHRARVIQVPRRASFELDLDGIEQAVLLERPKLLFLASPNNPDGSLAPEAVVERLLALPVIVVLDEAYVEFAPPGSSWLAQVLNRNNLVVLRTFSKWAGLAGLRVGWGAFPAGLLPHLWKVKQPYNVSVAASTAAQVSIAHRGQLEETGQKIIAERSRLMAALREFEWLRPYPSQANFILVQVKGHSAGELKRQLAQAGILVRYFNKPGLQDHIRVSVGKPEHTDALVARLKELEA